MIPPGRTALTNLEEIRDKLVDEIKEKRQQAECLNAQITLLGAELASVEESINKIAYK